MEMIRKLATEAAISDGTLLALAREVAEDATITSLKELTRAQAEELTGLLGANLSAPASKITWWPEAA